jgi:hypothetical protein
MLLLASPLLAEEPAWTNAERRQPMTADESKAFMRRLTQYVLDHHLRKDEASAQRGIIYEYFWVKKKGTPQQWIQGEALDTMHDGAWFAIAMANAYRATGDVFYKEVLTKWQLPFYLKMLNESDHLFTSERNDARLENQDTWKTSKEWLLQGREKGFVPYWWDDGGSVSLDMLRKNDGAAFYPCRNELAGRPNPEARLSGYSLGSSNHLAQDLGAMLEVTWLLFRDSKDPAEAKLAAAIAEAARNLQECRARHGAASIPAVLAACALANGDAALTKRIPDETWKSVLSHKNHYRNAFFDFKPGQKVTLPGFADDQQYRYYSALARRGTLAEPMAWKTVYDALTERFGFERYYDDAPRPAGINRFDLYPFGAVNGKLEHKRSERKGPFKGPVPIGSRMGPQNMICCGWALQALDAYPRLWSKAKREAENENLDVPRLTDGADAMAEPAVRSLLRHELGGGLRTWEAIFDAYGYIPTGIGCQTTVAGARWDEFSDTGGYAHLISAASQWVLVLEGKKDWVEHRLPMP